MITKFIKPTTANLENILINFIEKFESSSDWMVRPLYKVESKKILKFLFNQMPLNCKEKTSLYKLFLKNEINWIEFYGRCNDFKSYESINKVIMSPSIFLTSRKPTNTIKGINGMMKPISYYSIKTFRGNIQKILDIDSQRNLDCYSIWDLFCYDLPSGHFNLKEALEILKLKSNNGINFTLI